MWGELLEQVGSLPVASGEHRMRAELAAIAQQLQVCRRHCSRSSFSPHSFSASRATTRITQRQVAVIRGREEALAQHAASTKQREEGLRSQLEKSEAVVGHLRVIRAEQERRLADAAERITQLDNERKRLAAQLVAEQVCV
jgi:chromosome segregation ATPase